MYISFTIFISAVQFPPLKTTRKKINSYIKCARGVVIPHSDTLCVLGRIILYHNVVIYWFSAMDVIIPHLHLSSTSTGLLKPFELTAHKRNATLR